jgi:hypothetical protein
MARRVLRPFLIALGILALVGAIAWRPAAERQLVKLPAGLDETLRFEGTAVLPVDETTGLPRATPAELPLQLQRRIQTVDTTSGLAVVSEDITLQLGGREVLETHRYVVDRRDMNLENGEDSWAYEAANRADRAGTYRVTFPVGTDEQATYRVWNNETGQPITLGAGTRTRAERAGLDVIEFAISYRNPVAPYLTDRLTALGLPAELSPTQLAARLSAAGVDLQALAAELGPRLNADQRAGLTALLGTSVPLRYEFFYEGTLSVEPRSGVIVDLDVTSEGFAATPDLAALEQVMPLLEANVSLPAVATAAQALQQLSVAPAQTVLELRYRATDATVAERAADARDARRQLSIVRTWVPWGLGLAGVGMLAAGVALTMLDRRTGRRWEPPAPAVVDLTTPPAEPSTAATGSSPEPHANVAATGADANVAATGADANVAATGVATPKASRRG